MPECTEIALTGYACESGPRVFQLNNNGLWSKGVDPALVTGARKYAILSLTDPGERCEEYKSTRVTQADRQCSVIGLFWEAST